MPLPGTGKPVPEDHLHGRDPQEYAPHSQGDAAAGVFFTSTMTRKYENEYIWFLV
jgi:hypothetical protein